jgi:hypothetical protein
VTNTYDLIGMNPVAGSKVRVEARVYNYSSGVAANNLKVRFQVIGYNSTTDTEVPFKSCPPGTTLQGGRCTIGEATVGVMTPLEMTTAAIVWDTTDFGPANIDESSEYRVYVVLDPDNAIDEIYETEDPKTTYPCLDVNGKSCSLPKGIDPGQNNEGYGYLTIQHPSLSDKPDAAVNADVFMRPRALAAGNGRGSIKFNNVKAEINRPLLLRATVHSDRTHRFNSHLLVYDADPEKGGHVIATKLIHSGNKRGTSVWFDWIPTRLGKHTLFASVVKMSDDLKPDNHTSTLEVNVVPADTTPPQLAVTLTPNTLRHPDGRFVPITATIAVKDNQDRQPEIRLEAITHNESNDAGEDVEGEEFGTDDRTFSLRAKRDGRNGRAERVYKVVYSATDWSGNRTFTEAFVIVPRESQR